MGTQRANQTELQERMRRMLANAPWRLRFSTRNRITGPLLTVQERRPTERDTTRWADCGHICQSALRACRPVLRTILREVTDSSGRPLNLQDFLEGKMEFRGELPLNEVAGSKLSLLFRLQTRMRSMDRVELMAWRIERFTKEETMYWLNMAAVEPIYGGSALEWSRAGMRLMLAGTPKDKEQVRRMLETLRKEAR